MLLLALLACAEPRCLVFTGDVMLGRGVEAERARGVDLWAGIPGFSRDLWIGNLEGAVAPPGARCDKDPRLCLGFLPEALDGAPFAALSLANNHSRDYGPDGVEATRAALRARGIAALDWETSPHLVELDGRKVALVALNLAGRTDTRAALEEARLRVQLARALAPMVVVLPHWGMEYRPEPEPLQERAAEIFARWGASLVVGSHAHVAQPTCEKVGESTVFYGLGNHLFDQLPRATHQGLLLRCCPAEGAWTCTAWATARGERSAVPALGGPVDSCEVPEGAAVDLGWKAHWLASHALSVQALESAGPGAWLLLWRNPASLDGEAGLRLHVIRVEEDGHTTDLWRGTALSRPTVVARVERHEGREVLCALHRGDSFLHPEPDTAERLTRAWAWNGFGFDALEDPDCAGL